MYQTDGRASLGSFWPVPSKASCSASRKRGRSACETLVGSSCFTHGGSAAFTGYGLWPNVVMIGRLRPLSRYAAPTPRMKPAGSWRAAVEEMRLTYGRSRSQLVPALGEQRLVGRGAARRRPELGRVRLVPDDDVTDLRDPGEDVMEELRVVPALDVVEWRLPRVAVHREHHALATGDHRCCAVEVDAGGHRSGRFWPRRQGIVSRTASIPRWRYVASSRSGRVRHLAVSSSSPTTSCRAVWDA